MEQNGIQVIKKANPVHAIKLYEYKYSGREDVIFYNKTEKQPLSYIILKSDLDKILDLSLNKEIKSDSERKISIIPKITEILVP